MRKLSKLLILALALALLVGAVFAVNSFATDGDDIGIDGATRSVIDFEGIKFDKHSKVIGDTPATPTTSVGTDPFFDMVTAKYGHVRTVTTPGGNTWYEYFFEEAYTANATDKDDSVLAITRAQSINNLSYYVQEYDLSTRTEIPGNMVIFFEMRSYLNGTENKAGFRNRLALATYNTETNLWTGEGTGKTFSTNANEWVHVTIVAKIVKEFSTAEDGAQLVNYNKSSINLYINGELMGTNRMVEAGAISADLDVQLYYLGPGYAYGRAHTGAKADDGVAIDNVVRTTIPTAYAADVDNDKLAPLFAATNPVTNLSGAGKAVVYNDNYKLPKAEVGVAAYVNADEEYIMAATIEKALQEIKENADEEATIQLYANRYWPVHIDYPVTIDLNGFALQNGYTCPSDLSATMNPEDGTITFAYDLENSATFNYYLGAYGATGEVVKTVIVAPGNAVNKALLAGKVPVTVNGKTGTAPTGEFKIYDENGVEVTVDVVGEENKGKVYSVCPVIKTETLENNIAFYATIAGATTFYDNNNIQTIATGGIMPANVKIVLVTDCVYSATIYAPTDSTFTLDLNGKKLSAKDGAAIILVGPVNASAKNVDYFFYSSKDGAVIDTNKANNLIQSRGCDSNYVASYFFGYSDADTKATGRMTVNTGKMICYMNKKDVDSIKFYNAEIHTNGSHALVEVAQARMDYIVEFDTCDVFCDGGIVYAAGNAGNCNISIINSNIYGGGKQLFRDPAGTTSGTVTVTIVNSKIYNLELGKTYVHNKYYDSGKKKDVETDIYQKIVVDEASLLSFMPDMETANATNKIEGKVFLCKPEVVTINGTNYFTGYQWVPADTQYATFNFYNMPKSAVTADTPVTSTLTVAVGGWWGRGGEVGGKGASYYNPELDPNNAFATLEADVVYDAEGNRVTKTALEASDAGKVFTVCVDSVILEDEKIPVYAYVALSDGTYIGLTSNDLVAALKEVTGSKVLPSGSTLVLLEDCYLADALEIGQVKIDLNGNTLYFKSKGPTLYVNQSNANFFLYSSKEGARICTTPTDTSGSSYTMEVRVANAKVYFGYVDENTLSPYTIDVFCGAFINAQGCSNSVINVANVTIAGVGGDNYGMFNIRGGTTNVTYNLTNVEIYMEGRDPLFCLREATEGTFNAKNSNFYFGNGYRSLASWYGREAIKENNVVVGYKDRTGSATMNFEDSNIYGSVNLNNLVMDQAVITVTLKGNCKIPTISENVKVADDGYAILPSAGLFTPDGIMTPKNGIYGKQEYLLNYSKLGYCFISAPATGETVDVNAFKGQVFQNVTLDANVIVNLYIPAQENVYYVILNGTTHILDKTQTKTIGGKTYYIIAIEMAPKNGDAQANVVVYFANGDTAALPISVAYYAKALFALDGTNNEYVADSQRMMKYVLTYIREVASAMAGKDESTIFADLGDYDVDTGFDFQAEIKDTTALKPYITEAALDLSGFVSFAFKVDSNFVGTIRLEMPGMEPVEKTYTKAAGDNQILLISNIPAYLLRGDITITVTPAEGEVVVGAYNLATYVNAVNKQFTRATYAYAVVAAEYNTKYPTVNTVN